MRRRTLDALLATSGLIVAVILLAAGGLLTWAHNFVGNEVYNQLSSQQIFFPAKGSDSLNDPAIKPYLEQYAGQQMTNGAQAKAYADHFIAVHINEMTGGKTYAELSAASLADPNNTELAGLVQTVFRGETLRGLLLNAYAFGKMGTIAGIGAIVAWIGGGLMFVAAGLGFWHSRRAPETSEVFIKHAGAPAVEQIP